MKLILLGPPGSGKGTVSEKLEKDLNLLHISAGELLREEVQKKTTIGKDIKEYIDRGELVPNKFVVEMVKLEVKNKDNYILDGFPRSIEQAKEIEDLGITLVIYLEVPEKIVIERFAGRRVCKEGTHGYHIKYLPPKKEGICDQDGSPLVQRKDDKPEVIKERFRIYHQETQPLIDYYTKKSILKKVDGALAPEIVYTAVKKVVKKSLSR
ncbi:MAG: nucleoside monophosphate kinase [Nanoarchaeota archaeon]|nr:nucleoside monophosphate kinase [Nanoarchaeota archaeon]MBU1632807.1 nucleoside monophosphate kinase [Nanoarchaeota archaeon]MBU1876500.1 nucleoside monophosphate kinase [Nanoarchaeota archaeon]